MKWTQEADATLIEPYRPVPQLVESRVEKQIEVKEAIEQGRMVTIQVSNNQFFTIIQGKGQVGHAVQMKGVPDLDVQVMKSEDAQDAQATLTQDSRERLTEIKEGRQTVEQNIGVTKHPNRSRTLYEQHHQAKSTQDRSRSQVHLER